MITVDGTEVFASEGLTSDYKTYHINCAKATAASTITIGTSLKRAYINNLVVGSGTYVEPPVINITSDNPLEVANTAGNHSISYTIGNRTDGSALTATTEDSWISNINYSTSGTVTFTVTAQETGAMAREGTITLSYPGAKPKVVTVKQAAGAGGSVTYKYTFTSNAWAATLNGTAANWESIKNGSATGDSRGISIQAAATGAGATSPASYTGISNVTINASKSKNGVGSIVVKVGENTIGTISSFNTTATDYSFDVSNLSGKVSFVVTCTTSTLYVRDIAITATGTVAPQAPTYAVTLNDPTETGCSISATVDGNAISSGDEFEEGTVVTITATTGNDYNFGGWTLTGASAVNASLASTTFTIGKSAVTVGATFTPKGGGTATFTFGTNISATSGTINGVSLSTAKNNGSNAPAYNSNSSQLRLYRYNSMTLSCASNITSIVITYDAEYIGSDTAANVGSYSCANSVGTWTGSSKSVTITNTGTDNVQMRIAQIVVTYE